jgi:cysteine synthase
MAPPLRRLLSPLCVVGCTTILTTRQNSFAESPKTGIGGCIGKTPLIYIKSLSDATGCEIYAKCENLNPTGSVKDRAALKIIEELEQSGALKPGGTIVEGTGGNTGVALAQLAIARGYKALLYAPCNISQEKVDLMRRLGAELHLQPLVPFSSPEHYANMAHAEAARREGAVCSNQFENMANFRAHYSGTGPEIWDQAGHRVDAFVCAAGTGGTIAGTPVRI